MKERISFSEFLKELYKKAICYWPAEGTLKTEVI